MTCHSARTSPGCGDRRAQPLQAPVGVRDRALLLRVGLGGEDDGRVLADALGEERGVGDDGRRLLQRLLPRARGPAGRAAGRRAGGRARSSSPSAAAAAMPAASWPSAVGAQAGAGGGQDADLAQAAPVRRRRGPRAGRRRRGRAATMRPATFSSARAAWAPRGPWVRRSPQTMTTSSPASRRTSATPRDGLGGRARGRRELVEHARRRRARRSARRRTPRRRRARSARPRAAFGSSDDGRLVATASFTPLRAHALADAQVEDRRVVDGLAVEHEDGVGELEVGDRRLQRRAAERGVQRRAAARRRARESRCGEPSASRMRRWSSKPSSFVVSPPASAPTRRPRAPSAPAAASSARAPSSPGDRTPPSRTHRAA